MSDFETYKALLDKAGFTYEVHENEEYKVNITRGSIQTFKGTVITVKGHFYDELYVLFMKDELIDMCSHVVVGYPSSAKAKKLVEK